MPWPSSCGGDPSPFDLTCTELMLETPPGAASGQTPGDRWQYEFDGGACSPDEAGSFDSTPERPNLDELWTCERERLDGALEEKITNMIERSERYRPAPDYLAENTATGIAEGSCLSASARRGLVTEVLDACQRFELTTQTAALTVNYLDRMLSTNLVKRRNYDGTILKAVMLACMNIAIKLEEVLSVTPDELQMHLPPSARIETVLVNLVENMVLIQLEWRLAIPTAVDLFTPFICYLQAIPAWVPASRHNVDMPMDWAKQHITIWEKSCDFFHGFLSDAAVLEFSASELAVGAIFCTLEQFWENDEASRALHLQPVLDHIETQFPNMLNHTQTRRCRDLMQRSASPDSQPAGGRKRKASDLQPRTL